MKKNLILFLLLLGLLPHTGRACDACSILSGVTPMDLKSQAGVFFRYRTFRRLNAAAQAASQGTNKTHHIPGNGSGHGHGGSDSYQQVRESYYRSNLNLRWFFRDRWNLQATIPLVYNFENYGDKQKSGMGLGDMTAIVNFGLLTGQSGQHVWRLFVGSGLKLPSGWRFRRQIDRQNFPDIQGTTGTLDFIFQTEASWRYKRHGLTGNAVFRLNTTNGEGIRYGNFFNKTLNYFFQFEFDKINTTVLPFVGSYLEMFSGRYDNGERGLNSGGTAWFANVGVNWYTGRFSCQPQVQIPIRQWMHGQQLISDPIVSLQTSIAF